MLTMNHKNENTDHLVGGRGAFLSPSIMQLHSLIGDPFTETLGYITYWSSGSSIHSAHSICCPLWVPKEVKAHGISPTLRVETLDVRIPPTCMSATQVSKK